MAMQLNRSALFRTDVDSGALHPLGVIVRRFPTAGTYTATVMQDERPVGSFILAVEQQQGATQVDVDLAAVRDRRPKAAEDCGCGKAVHEAAHVRVGTEAYVVFHVSQGAGYSVHVGPATEGIDARPWDSRELQEGDLFAVTLLRPGRYRAIERTSSAEAAIRVAYPKPGERRGQRDQAANVEVGGRAGIRPKRLELEAAQPHVYRISAPSRIVVELQEPDDGPTRPEHEPRFRFRRVQPRRPTGAAGAGKRRAEAKGEAAPMRPTPRRRRQR